MSNNVVVFEDRPADTAVHEWAEMQGGSIELPEHGLALAGRSGALLRVVILKARKAEAQWVLVKLHPPRTPGWRPNRHKAALRIDPSFADQHLVRELYPPHPVGDGRYLTFQAYLPNTVTLADLEATDLPLACVEVVRLLVEWTKDHRLEKETVSDFVEREISREPGGALVPRCALRGELGPGTALGSLKIDVYRGPALSDVHTRNVLVPRDLRANVDIHRARFVDYDDHSEDAPLTRDLLSLLLSAVLPQLHALSSTQADALAQHVIAPVKDDVDGLPKHLQQLVWDMYSAADVRGGGAEAWYHQYLLSIVAEALRHATYDDAGPAGREWFRRLAASAAATLAAKIYPARTPGALRDVAVTTADQGPQGGTIPSAKPPAPAKPSATVVAGVEPGPSTWTVGRRPVRRLVVLAAVVLAAPAIAVVAVRCCGGAGATAAPTSEPAGIPPIVAHDVWEIADRVALGSDQISDGMYEFVHTIVFSRATTPAWEGERWVEELAWLRSDGAGCRVLAPLSPDGKREPSEEPFSVSMDEPSAEMSELRRQLQVWSGGDRGPTGVLRAAAGLTAQRYLDRSQRVALVRVLATTVGVRPLGEWRDSHGRSGIAVQAVVETRHLTIREILMIDPRTASLLAHQTIEAPAGGDMRIVGEVLYLDSGRDRRPGCRLLA